MARGGEKQPLLTFEIQPDVRVAGQDRRQQAALGLIGPEVGRHLDGLLDSSGAERSRVETGCFG